MIMGDINGMDPHVRLIGYGQTMFMSGTTSGDGFGNSSTDERGFVMMVDADPSVDPSDDEQMDRFFRETYHVRPTILDFRTPDDLRKFADHLLATADEWEKGEI